jgi:crotonobetainyl-CoA:carnitine CoA-transferase CaiB-like acyl-CoA transferase
MKHPRPLEGVVVVELGHSVAAPYAGLILADLGARVIKVENPKHGDYARDWGPPFWGDISSSFASLNRGKESITVDFGNPEEAAALRRLIIEKADGVIQNLRPGILDAYGLSAESFRKEKPALIWCDIGAFGAAGPMAQKPGYDPLVQASSGIMSVTGEGNRPPVRVGISLVDMGSGMWAAMGFLASFIARMKEGEGARVSTSLFETGLAWMTLPLAGFEAAGDVRKPYGSGVAEIVPYQAFETRNGWLMIAAGNDNLFRKFCDVLGREDLATDPAFATNSARVVNRERLIPIVAEAVARFDVEDLGRLLDAHGVPSSPLLGVQEVAHHPQVKALDITAECDDGLSLVSIPIAFDGMRPRATRRAPRLGEHNANFKSDT